MMPETHIAFLPSEYENEGFVKPDVFSAPWEERVLRGFIVEDVLVLKRLLQRSAAWESGSGICILLEKVGGGGLGNRWGRCTLAQDICRCGVEA